MTMPLLSPAVRRLSAIGFLFCLCGLLWAIAADPLLTSWSNREAAIETTEKQLAAMRRRAQWGAQEKQVLEVARQAVDNSPLLIRGANASQASAQFQADIRRRVDGAGAQTRSIQALPVAKVAGLERVVVRLEGSIGSDRLLDWLQSIEGQPAPLMVIEVLELRGPEFQQAGSPVNTSLQFRLDVAGYRRAEP